MSERSELIPCIYIYIYIARYEPYIKNLFVPIERITGRVMYAYESIDREEVLVVIHIV